MSVERNLGSWSEPVAPSLPSGYIDHVRSVDPECRRWHIFQLVDSRLVQDDGDDSTTRVITASSMLRYWLRGPSTVASAVPRPLKDRIIVTTEERA